MAYRQGWTYPPETYRSCRLKLYSGLSVLVALLMHILLTYLLYLSLYTP